MAWRKDTSGTGYALAILVAGGMLLGSIGTVIVATGESGRDADHIEQPVRKAEAEVLLEMLVDSTGTGWEDGADGIDRLGLAAPNGSIDLDKVDQLRGASFGENGTNGLLDYDEALAALGLDQNPAGEESLSFHLRMYPVGLERQIAQLDLSGIRTLYIGEWDALDDVTVPQDGNHSAMAADARAGVDAQMANDTVDERAMLTRMGLGFDDEADLSDGNTSYVDTGNTTEPIRDVIGRAMAQGDVFPDDKKFLDEVLHQRIDDYHLLVVGSGVRQSSLTTAVTKQAIADWVLAGGDLMVLGSSGADFQWLQPLFSVGTSTVNGQAFAPDVAHPMLKEPHELDWPAYDNRGLTWDIKDKGSKAHYEDFDHIIQADGEDVLTVSLDGAFGDGRIFLTGYQPKHIDDDLGEDEAFHFMHNMVIYADRDHLYLDYGPTVPDTVSVMGAVRQGHVWDAKLGQVPVRLELLVWQN